MVDAIGAAIDSNVGNVYAAFLEGFRMFFAESAADPLVISPADRGGQTRSVADHHDRQCARSSIGPRSG